MSGGDDDNDAELQAGTLERFRTRQWIYLGPILAAPLAHIAVSSYRHAKTPRMKAAVIGVGVLGSTALSVGMRMVLMVDSCYIGDKSPASRVQTVSAADDVAKGEILRPSLWQIAKEAATGFG